jgi:hypothetical protein
VGFRHDESQPGPELEFFEVLKIDERAGTLLKRERWTFW